MIEKGEVYYKWLGINPGDQPPDHYRLLGISRFETDDEVIRNAADRQLTHVRRLGRNEYTEVGQELLNEIMAARICLLKPGKREAYDASLESATPPPMRPPIPDDVPGLVSRKSSLMVGADPSCDLVVDHATVSSVHCKITRKRDVVQIRDWNSTNGTYVNLRRIKKATITQLDVLTLGPEVLLSLPPDIWPPTFRKMEVRLIGRSPYCDIQIDHPSVSLFHAKVYKQGAKTYIEDMNSTNGTHFIMADNAIQQVQGPRAIDEARVIRCGAHQFDPSKLS